MEKNKKICIQEVIWNFIDKHTNLVYLVLITTLSLVIRGLFMKYNSGDYDMFLKPWFNDLKMYGGLPGLAYNIGNYTPIYMTILSILTYFPIDSLFSIKLVSIIFDYVGAIYVYKIAKELLKDNKNKDKICLIIYGIYLLLPTVFLNSAYWSQSDSIYTSFVLISLYYLIKNDFVKGIIFFSIAFAFKFQTIFVLPLYILMYFNNRKLKFRYFLIIPLTVFIFSIPKIIFTGNFLCGFEVYFNQTGTYSQYLTLNLPNFYSIFLKGYSTSNPNLIDTPFIEMGTVGVIVTLMIFIMIAFMAYKKKIKFDKYTIIDFSLWAILICGFFLPQMHERYLFMADIISLLYFAIHKKKYYIPILVEFISLNGYMYLLFAGFAINMSMLSIVFLGLIILYTKDMYQRYFK